MNFTALNAKEGDVPRLATVKRFPKFSALAHLKTVSRLTGITFTDSVRDKKRLFISAIFVPRR